MAKTEWTDELRAQVIADYAAAEPTPETSVEIVKEIAENTGTTPNGVMAILLRDGSYIKKSTEKKESTGTKGTRVNKAEAVKNLTDTINANSLSLDEDIISKLTGKAAAYINKILTEATTEG